jgi:hypothetical protein
VCVHTRSSVSPEDMEGTGGVGTLGAYDESMMRGRVCREHPGGRGTEEKVEVWTPTLATTRGTPSTRYPRARRRRSWGPYRLSLAPIPCTHRVPLDPRFYFISSPPSRVPHPRYILRLVARRYEGCILKVGGQGNMKVSVGFLCLPLLSFLSVEHGGRVSYLRRAPFLVRMLA